MAHNKLIAMQGLDDFFKACKISTISKDIRRIEELLKDDNNWVVIVDEINTYKALEGQRNNFLQVEEVIWMQWSREHWLHHSDKNTKFFHGKADQRTKTNAIRKLKYDNECWWKGDGHCERILLSIYPRGSDFTETLFPKSLNLPALASLDLTNFAFCGGKYGRVEPFLAFTKLKSLVIRSCMLIDAQILSISSETLVNLAMHDNSPLIARIELFVPSLCTFNYTGDLHTHKICGSGLSSVKQVNINSR
ncbi:unnamed protein product [Vicia faba]|uniref:Uncharacterized protein n=1 Tax=Vicia faba TaxID=3906 RepID=A0AAV1ALX1_VICFA|nr:unnamed protein product [Vicia faba]